MRLVTVLLLALLAWFSASCGPSVDMPKGTSKGYRSARLTVRDPRQPVPSDSTERAVHRMIQDSLRRQFSAKGLAYGNGNAELAVAYLVIYQEPGITASYDDYFGHGRDSGEIADIAHIKGTVESGRPDYFQRAGIVIDIIDSRSNKLVYRDFAAGDVVRGASPASRAARIDAAVAQALAGFFR